MVLQVGRLVFGYVKGGRARERIDHVADGRSEGWPGSLAVVTAAAAETTSTAETALQEQPKSAAVKAKDVKEGPYGLPAKCIILREND